MAQFTLNDFQSQVFSKGLAENNKFEMLIATPPALSNVGTNLSGLVNMMCEISNFPPLNLMVRPMNLYGPAHQRPVSIDYGGDGIAASFYLDREMNVKRFFDLWMTSIVNGSTDNVSYQNDYITNIVIRQLSDGQGGLQNAATFNPRGVTEEATYAVQLEEAFPRSMNLVDLNTGSQNQISRLTVVFAFRKWKYETYGPQSPFSRRNTLSSVENGIRQNVFYTQ